jgi:hypothetical protein
MKGKKTDVSIFVSYAHRDPPLFRQLLESTLRWPGVAVQLWTDESIVAGTVPDQQIRTALDQMHIFLALITPMFDASDYIQQVEVPVARRRHRKDEILVAPILVSHPGGNNCNWLLGLEPLPDKKKSWAEIRRECRASEGVWGLVEQVRGR